MAIIKNGTASDTFYPTHVRFRGGLLPSGQHQGPSIHGLAPQPTAHGSRSEVGRAKPDDVLQPRYNFVILAAVAALPKSLISARP